MSEDNFKIGRYRPIYLWAGPGTIRMNKIKFMDYPVDEFVHREAHYEPAARLVLNTLYANWVHLMYDWGFPPEIEIEDWEDFKIAAANYHAVGSPVFAYIQTSNCVYQGSFVDKDWYAVNPRGKKIYYYSGRYMVDWMHPAWIKHLKDLIKGAISRGADGIFFDNLWYGEEPSSLMGAWLGGAGCYCERCQALYKADTGQEIPEKILPERAEVADYIRWRANHVTQTMQELANYVRDLKPGTPISANDYDVTMRNSFLIYGIDVEALARIQDVIMVENFALPRWDQSPRPRLANNALTIRNTREFVREQAHLNVLSYDVGIGFDPVYPPRRHQQGIGEAAACGASMTVKGTEYNNGKRMTLLTDQAYHAQQAAIGTYHRWLEDNHSVYENRINSAPVGLYYPGETLWQHWMELSAIYYGAGQALTKAGIPWRVVREDDPLDKLAALLIFSEEDQLRKTAVPRIHVPSLPGWTWQKPSIVARGGLWHDLVEGVGLFLLQAYHGSKLARKFMDGLNMAKLVTQTALFNMPETEAMEVLLAALPGEITPVVRAKDPVLIETWQKENEIQVHLLNYGSKPQKVEVQFKTPVAAKVLSPDAEMNLALQGNNISFMLDIYSILILD